jgi:hypothetical protein
MILAGVKGLKNCQGFGKVNEQPHFISWHSNPSCEKIKTTLHHLSLALATHIFVLSSHIDTSTSTSTLHTNTTLGTYSTQSHQFPFSQYTTRTNHRLTSLIEKTDKMRIATVTAILFALVSTSAAFNQPPGKGQTIAADAADGDDVFSRHLHQATTPGQLNRRVKPRCAGCPPEQ